MTITIASGKSDLRLDNHTDYVLRADKPVTSPLVVNGGRHVRMAPTEIRLTRPGRALYLLGQSGSAYIEGLHIAGDQATEGIDLDQRLGADVILQSTLVDRLRGSKDTNHADVIQSWAGPGKLLVDGMDASSDYQGMFLLPRQHFDGPWPELVSLSNVQLRCPGYALWRDPGMPYPVVVDNVWVAPDPKYLRWRDGFLWPKKVDQPADTTWDKVQVGVSPTPMVDPAMVGCGSAPSWET